MNLSGSDNLNLFLGDSAGYFNSSGGQNTFVGHEAGNYNTTGNYNTFLGVSAGNQNTGDANVIIGVDAGLNNMTGSSNTFIGLGAGHNSSGNSNLFLGREAGYHELGSNKLYIENCGNDSTEALIYGEFDSDILLLNATAHIRDALVLKPIDTAPSSPEKGMMYMDSITNKLMVYDGTTWRACW